MTHTYLCIDLKSFYASVECVARGLDPLRENLVVADLSRTEKTICLAVSPSLKACGIPGRPRLFEVIRSVDDINRRRLAHAPGHRFSGSATDSVALRNDPSLRLDYIAAPPRMAEYVRVSTKIYSIYLKYIAPEDIHVYSIDEVFIDLTRYLAASGKTAREFAMMLIRHVLRETGITATAGIGTNLYLCKIAMDIVAKKLPADKDGVRIAELDEMSYRRELWQHRPLTDFWRVGRGIAKKLEDNAMYTMGDVARCSMTNEALLYRLFGVNAELLIDHAWGWESCRMEDIKAYRPETNSLCSSQVLKEPYPHDKAAIIVREMAEQLSLQLVEKRLVTDQIELAVSYDNSNLHDPRRMAAYRGAISTDFYGRAVPKSVHGGGRLGQYCSSSRLITDTALRLFESLTDKALTVRRISLGASRVLPEDIAPLPQTAQLDLFSDPDAQASRQEAERMVLERERHRQDAMVSIRQRYGKNAILKGTDFQEGATVIERNGQIGGHRA